MSEVIILQGIQGSGKSTWALDYVTKEPTKRVRINRDSIRKMFGKYWVLRKRKNYVMKLKIKLLLMQWLEVFDIVIDDTNLNPKST